jgi:hypothetical protein
LWMYFEAICPPMFVNFTQRYVESKRALD